MNSHFILATSLCFYVFYIFAIAIVMFKKRKAAVLNKTVHHSYFKAHSGAALPDELVVVARHFDNQFQVPLLFMVTGSLLLTFATLPLWVAILGWGFVMSRCMHTWIHLGSNKPLTRAMFYALGWFIVFILWIKIVVHFV